MNTTTIDGQECALIPLNHGKFAIVDIDMFEELNQWNWRFDNRSGHGYVLRRFSVKKEGGKCTCRTVLMHVVIAQTPVGLLTDHINGNRLDNRQVNLRHATTSENAHNRAISRHNKLGIKGVSRDSYNQNRFRASIRINRKEYNLGRFPTPELARAAYNAAAVRLHGEFAKLSVTVAILAWFAFT